MRIIFMGTSSFGIPTLQALINSPEHQVVAVYTKQPAESGRGMKPQRTAIHNFALANRLPVFVPESIRGPKVPAYVTSMGVDVIIVAAYGLIITEEILAAPSKGCFNIHPSALPRWRGAAPIQHTILSKDTRSAVCIIKMDTDLDTGPILIQEELGLDDQITAGELSHKTAEIGAMLTLESLKILEHQQESYTIQSTAGVTYARKLTKQDEHINWEEDVYSVHCRIRALSPSPGAHFFHNNQRIKIIKSNYVAPQENVSATYKPGEVVSLKPFAIKCGDSGLLLPELLQRSGQTKLTAPEFLRGFRIKIGEQCT